MRCGVRHQQHGQRGRREYDARRTAATAAARVDAVLTVGAGGRDDRARVEERTAVTAVAAGAPVRRSPEPILRAIERVVARSPTRRCIAALALRAAAALRVELAGTGDRRRVENAHAAGA